MRLPVAQLVLLGCCLTRPAAAEPPPPPGATAGAERGAPPGPSPLLGLDLDDVPAPEPWFLGAQLGFGTGLAPEVGGRAVLFAERSRLREPSVRLAAVLQPNPGEVNGYVIRHTVYAARAELCSPALGTRTLEWRGCGAIDAGVVVTSAAKERAVRDTGPWGALGLAARLRQWLGPRFGIEGEVGGLFPLSRYSIIGEGVVYHRDSAGLSLSFGVDFALD